MKVHPQTKIILFAGISLVYIGLISMIYSFNGSLAPLLLIATGSLLSETLPKKESRKSISLPEFILYLSVFLMCFWYISTTGQDISLKLTEFCTENRYDWKFIVLLGASYFASIIIRYQKLKLLTPKDVVEYYEAKE